MSARRTSEVPTAIQQSAQSRMLRDLRQQAPKAYEPDNVFRKERKVLDAGARVEAKLEKLINAKRRGQSQPDIACWRLPGVKSVRLSGITYLPDAAGYVPELCRLVKPQASNIAGRPDFNVVFEFKSQHTTGSAEKKISAAIVDLAHLCDERETVAAVILDTPILTDQQVIAFKSEGELHAVVVLTAKEVRAGMLVPELIRVAKQRRTLRRRIGPRGGYTATRRPSAVERALALRVSQRQQMAKAMRKYEQTPLVR